MNQILMFLVKETMKDDDYASVMTSAEISNKKEMQELNKLLAKFKHLANEAIAIKINEIIELTRRQKTMEILSVTGTQLGVYKDVLSNLKLPCLPGKKIIDPNEYTTQMTQVLGAYIHEDEEYTSLSTRTFIRPISGTIKLENGNFQEINSGIFVNEDLGHIVTGKLDLDSQNSGADQKIVPVYNKNDLVGRRHKYTGNVIRSLQSEISQRRQFFNSQNKKEEAIISEVLKFLSEYILYLKNIDVKDISESDLEIDKKLIEIALPISELATSVTRIFNSEKERRDISLTDISNYINENIVMETSLVNPILELTYFDKIEVEAMKKLSHELDKLAELSDFAGRRLNNEVDKLRERFDQLNSIDAAVNPDIQPAKLAAETRFSNAVKILITEVNGSFLI